MRVALLAAGGVVMVARVSVVAAEWLLQVICVLFCLKAPLAAVVVREGGKTRAQAPQLCEVHMLAQGLRVWVGGQVGETVRRCRCCLA